MQFQVFNSKLRIIVLRDTFLLFVLLNFPFFSFYRFNNLIFVQIHTYEGNLSNRVSCQNHATTSNIAQRTSSKSGNVDKCRLIARNRFQSRLECEIWNVQRRIGTRLTNKHILQTARINKDHPLFRHHPSTILYSSFSLALPLSRCFFNGFYNIFRTFEIYVEFQFSRCSIFWLEILKNWIILLFICKGFWNFFSSSSSSFLLKLNLKLPCTS